VQNSFASVAGASRSPSIARYSDASRRVRNLSSLTVAPESRVVVDSTAEAFDTESIIDGLISLRRSRESARTEETINATPISDAVRHNPKKVCLGCDYPRLS
jgi:hypothetical protein